MLKALLFTSLFATFAGCSTTPPDGDAQLGLELKTFRERESKVNRIEISKGRPIHVTGWVYGQVTEEGDIWVGGPVMFFIGREELNLEDMGLPRVEERKEEKHGKRT